MDHALSSVTLLVLVLAAASALLLLLRVLDAARARAWMHGRLKPAAVREAGAAAMRYLFINRLG